MVKEKFAVALPALAVTVYGPAALLAVNVGAVATPCEFVVAVFSPANVPLAPLAGAVKVTDAPLTRKPLASFTVACSGAKAVLIATLCPVLCGSLPSHVCGVGEIPP